MTHNFLIHTSAKVDPSATLSNGNKILRHATIGPGVSLGENVIVGAGVQVGAGSSFGNNVVLEGYMPEDDHIRYEEDTEEPEADLPPETETVVHDNCHIADGTRVEKGVILHGNVSIGADCLIEENTRIGQDCVLTNQCILGINVVLAPGSVLNDSVIIEKNAHLDIPINAMAGVRIGQQTQCRPKVHLRAITPQGNSVVKKQLEQISLHQGVYIGDEATLFEGLTVEEWAMAAAGATLRHHVPAYALVSGEMQIRGFVCPCETLLSPIDETGAADKAILMECPACGKKIEILRHVYRKMEDPLEDLNDLAQFLLNPTSFDNDDDEKKEEDEEEMKTIES
jgi:acetyltransferase-like isoleucine patch superfamily enzyme